MSDGESTIPVTTSSACDAGLTGDLHAADQRMFQSKMATVAAFTIGQKRQFYAILRQGVSPHAVLPTFGMTVSEICLSLILLNKAH